MPAADFVDHLRHRGIRLELTGGTILAKPRHLLTNPIRQMIRSHKAQLVDYLAANAQPQDREPGTVVDCPTCGNGHFWQSPGGWMCSTCTPVPADFTGDTLTIHPNGPRAPRPPTGEARNLDEALAEVCTDLPISPATVRADMHPADVTAFESGELSIEGLREYARALVEQREIRAGIKPHRFTGIALCRGCGAVWVPEHQDGRNLSSCPWCENRRHRGPRPKPTKIARDGTDIGRPLDWQGVDEVPEDRVAILELKADSKREQAERVAGLARDFYNHLFGPAKETSCCVAPAGRYCAEGQRLRDLYYDAAREANRGGPHGRNQQ